MVAEYVRAQDLPVYRHEAERVMPGQRLMRAASGIFLGWESVEGICVGCVGATERGRTSMRVWQTTARFGALDGGHVFEHRYRIVVRGALCEAARQAFAELKMEQTGSDTVLRGDLDQAALFGALTRVKAFGLELVEIAREQSAMRAVSGA